MNWTGGRLQRHTNAPDTAKHRQQQHFAKVKANILPGKKGSPQKHPNFDRIRKLYEGPSGSTTGDWQSLERSSRHVESQRRNPRWLQTSHRVAGESRSPHIQISQQQSSRALGNNLHMVNVTIHDSARLADAKKPEKNPGSSATPSDDENINEERDSLAQKRRKILQTCDWVSVGFQRAPRLKYVPPKKEAQIGRRRKVLDGHRARYSSKFQSKILPPVAQKNQPLPLEGFERKACRKPGPTDVKISVGNKVILPGISSSAQSNRYSNGSVQLQSFRPQSESLDIMLLDNESRRTSSMQPCSRPSTIRSKNRGMTTPQPQFRSSSASLQHPKPQSSIVASILRSDSLDEVESTLAEVGRFKPVTSSQVMDNDIWETWMTGLNLPDEASSVRIGISSQEENMQEQIERISPGVSAAPTYANKINTGDESNTHRNCGSLDELLRPGLAGSSELGLDSYTASDVLDDYTTDMDNLQSSPLQEPSIHSSASALSRLPQSNFKDLSPIPELACNKESQASQSQPSLSSNRISHRSGSSTSPLERQKSQQILRRFVPKTDAITPRLSHSAAKQSIEARKNSANESWRQFVFGSDSEDVDIFHRHAEVAELPREPACSEESYQVPQEFLGHSTGYSVSIGSSAVGFSSPDHQHSAFDHRSQDLVCSFSDATKSITESAPSRSYTAHYSTVVNATSSYDSDTLREYSNYPLVSSSSNLAPTNVALRDSSITPIDLMKPKKR